jgi:anthranilate synthase component 2
VILLIDNYDSFTFNLYQELAGLGCEVRVRRNDEIEVDEALASGLSAVVISPGPGRPQSAGITPELLRRAPAAMPVLGICLGHQALVERYGGELAIDPAPTHGKSSLVHHTGEGLFRGLPNPLSSGRYHSLVAVRDALPDVLRLCAWTEDGTVMAVEHIDRPHFGLQFHPESILTPQGTRVLARFLSAAGQPTGAR